ncbi:interferon regulatory factor 1 isoform X2 [Sphaerodactylus townsendi]|uniref:interferon regulatory factor 1 isoform X2 n=1 Tax=Sphaerodactylus townsendi TaxID=933632 RepID=UPI002027210D|nr:interferon regulatory factor 1 isoform X2 [Sphaerodactylus townsendi]
MPQPRMRMRPWLEMQINSNKIPGLVWINKEEQLFQIPWKHAAKHGWELEKDACLFRNWAIHTGRYKKGEIQPDPKTWKANFRCAMNSLPDIEEVKDKSISKGSSAVRVYRMLPLSAKSQKKEKKPKSSKIKNGRKSVEDIKIEETVEATNNILLPDDHRGYSRPSYLTEEREAESTSIIPDSHELSKCDLSNTLTDWRSPMDMLLPDSTNDMYPFQVSPNASCSDADEDDTPSSIYFSQFNVTDWQQTFVGGKGYFSNESGTQNSYLDIILEQDAAIDTTSAESIQTDVRTNLDSFWEALPLTVLHPISC